MMPIEGFDNLIAHTADTRHLRSMTTGCSSRTKRCTIYGAVRAVFNASSIVGINIVHRDCHEAYL